MHCNTNLIIQGFIDQNGTGLFFLERFAGDPQDEKLEAKEIITEVGIMGTDEMDEQELEKVKLQIEGMTEREANIFLLGLACAGRVIDNNDAYAYIEIIEAAKRRIKDANNP